ncbi:MAG: GAF domain-containing protein [Clostridiales bacterium]|nr:GAF domain-containing protein [Clostridiales bacterium]
MDNNTILSLNNVIYQIYNVTDFTEMRISVLNSLKTLIPNSCGSILMASEAGSRELLCDPVCVPQKYLGMEQRYLKMEEYDYSRWLIQRKQTTVMSATSLMPDEQRVKTAVYQSCFEPFGLHYSIDLTIVNNGQFLAVLALYRTKEESDFGEDEVFLLQTLSDHLNARFFSNKMLRKGPYDMLERGFFIKKYSLTAREAEILLMILTEKSNEEISESLCISVHTLKKHLQNLYRKTGVSNRVQLLGLRDNE